jgi:uncharacterized damage-inducible protein DinB
MLFDYDTWANDRVFDCVSRLSEEQLRHNLSTSHDSIFGTLVHIVGAEEVWLARWRAEPGVGLLDASTVPSLDALQERWQMARRGRDTFVASLDDATVDDEIEITTTGGKTYRHSFRHMFQHLVNHSSYHRGQIVTMLRQLGVEPPATDLIRYLREQAKS